MFVICRKFKLLDSCGIPYDAQILCRDIIFNLKMDAIKAMERMKEWYPDYDYEVIKMIEI